MGRAKIIPPLFAAFIRIKIRVVRFVVGDHGGHQLAGVYFEEEPGRGSAFQQLRYGYSEFSKARFATSIRCSALKGFSIRS